MRVIIRQGRGDLYLADPVQQPHLPADPRGIGPCRQPGLDRVGVQDEQRKTHQVVTVIGAVVFRPCLFFLQRDNQKTAELARLKGAMAALEQASVRRNCGIEHRRQPTS